MPRHEPKLIEDFLMPALNENLYPDLLQWEDLQAQIFSLRWNHKSSRSWTEEDCAVFVGWDKKKNRYTPEKKDYLMHSKQRFRAALHKLDRIRKLPSPDKCLKRFCICEAGATRRRRSSSRHAQELPNSPIPSDSEIQSMYPEVSPDVQLSSPASTASSGWDFPSDLDLETNSDPIVPQNLDSLLQTSVPDLFLEPHPSRTSVEGQITPYSNVVEISPIGFQDGIILYQIPQPGPVLSQRQFIVQQPVCGVTDDQNSYQMQINNAPSLSAWMDHLIGSTVTSDSALEPSVVREEDGFPPLAETFLDLDSMDSMYLGDGIPAL